jgi:hypothetical protein
MTDPEPTDADVRLTKVAEVALRSMVTTLKAQGIPQTAIVPALSTVLYCEASEDGGPAAAKRVFAAMIEAIEMAERAAH